MAIYLLIKNIELIAIKINISFLEKMDR